MPAPTLFVRQMPFRFGEPVPLSDCSGLRDREGMPVPCPSGCVVHFDAWADVRAHEEETGVAYSPYPNSLLPWVSHLPHTALISSWHGQEHPCFAGMLPISVRCFSTVDTFIDGLGEVCPAWVVTVDDQTDDSHFTALFLDSQLATAFAAAEVAARLEYCDCE